MPVRILGFDSIFQLTLSGNITSAAIPHDESVRKQNSDLFCRKIRLVLEKGGELGQKKPKDVSFENIECIICK